MLDPMLSGIKLVITDLNLGHGVNGIDICKKVKNCNQSITTIVISGDDIPTSEYVDIGISKPFGFKEFTHKMKINKIL